MGKTSVDMRWRPGEDLPCITEYQVTLCQENSGCHQSSHLSVTPNLDQLLYSNTSLSECTNYFLKILPIYGNKVLSEKVVNFQTKFPPLTNLSGQLGPITASVSQNLDINLAWSSVKCAKQYQVFQKNNNNQWELINKTQVNSFKIKAVFCTQYQFGIRTIVGSVNTDIVPLREKIVTKIENPEYYILPDFQVVGTLHGANLSWSHR